jgi:hypothetical protein
MTAVKTWRTPSTTSTEWSPGLQWEASLCPSHCWAFVKPVYCIKYALEPCYNGFIRGTVSIIADICYRGIHTVNTETHGVFIWLFSVFKLQNSSASPHLKCSDFTQPDSIHYIQFQSYPRSIMTRVFSVFILPCLSMGEHNIQLIK